MNKRGLKFLLGQFFLIALLIIVRFPAAQSKVLAASSSRIIGRSGEGFLEQREGFLILHIKGTPYEMGYQHGVLLKDHIRALMKEYIEKHILKIIYKGAYQTKEGYGLDSDFIDAPMRTLEKHLPLEYREEIKGLAKGAEITEEEALWINTFGDIAEQKDPRNIFKSLLQCTNVVVFGKATKDGRLFHGRNFDWGSEGIAHKHALVVVAEPEKGNKFVSIGWTGIVGVVSGMNEKGISIAEETIATTEDFTLEGVSLLFLLREAIQYSNNIEDVIKIITKRPRTAGYHITICDGKIPDVRIVEYSAHHYAIRKPLADNTIHGGEKYDQPLLYEYRRLPEPQVPRTDSSTPSRNFRLSQLIKENYGEIDYKKMIEFMSDKKVVKAEGEGITPSSVCNADTLHSVVFDPKGLKFWLAQGVMPACDGEYLEFELRWGQTPHQD